MIFVAKGTLLWFMTKLQIKGFVVPWRIYVQQIEIDNIDFVNLLKYKLFQIKEDGIFIYYLLYFYWLILYGKENNPYEIEARNKQKGINNG